MMPAGRKHRFRSRPVGALVVALSLAAACIPGPSEPKGVEGVPPEPLVRGPYLQDVSHDGATLLWRTDADAAGTVHYRVGGGPWQEAEGERLGRGDRRVRLGDLPPGTPVQYRLESAAGTLDAVEFRTAPRPGEGDSTAVLAFGDSGYGGEAQAELARRMEELSWDLAVHVGDIAYSDATEEELTERHFQVYWELLRRVPLFPSVGNHDIRTRGGEPYDRAFEWPGEEEGRRYYAVRWGRTLFLSLDTSTEEPLASLLASRGKQYTWLLSRLEEAETDPGVDWIVVFMHRPIYSHGVGPNAHGPDRDLRVELAALFQRFGVDLVLQGHDHHYERTHAIRSGRPAPPGCGTVYMVTGGGGGSRFGRDVEQDFHTAAVSRAFHFLRLVIRAGEIRVRAIGRDGGTVDRFEVRQFDPDEADRAERCAVGSEAPDPTTRSNVRFRAMSGLRPASFDRSSQEATSVGGPMP